ncbi:MAG: response regulator [Defluviitaleaceae bacterium]|nr:response regulator [Defluviitaleaceae bacterium]
MEKTEKNSLLIVDDDTSNLLQLANILQPEYTIYAAKDGSSALKTAEKSMPDLILLDVIMPDMNGFEVFAELQKSSRTKTIPVIFITGLRGSEDEEKGLALGAADYISKPFNSAIVKLRVRNQIKLINLQRDLEYAVTEARAANNAKSNFLANMSHEIRTPMNVIIGLTELMLDDEIPAADSKDYLIKIDAAGNTLMGLINDVLDISKIESGKFTLAPVKYDIAEFLGDIITLNTIRIYDKPITFKLNAEGNLLRFLFGDDLRLKQIINNLLSNAFKYTPAGTVTLDVKNEREGENGVRLNISVSDTGIGIRSEDMDKLFKDYNQVDMQANRSIQGTGLGLPIVKGLAELMGGDVFVESEYGTGTKFSVSMLHGFVGDETIGTDTAEALCAFRYDDGKKKSARKLARPNLEYKNVLVVDDFPTNLDVAKGLLGKYKMHVDGVASGQEAIGKIKLGNPFYDAIFMDHMMPGMDGVETTQFIRAVGTDYARTVPIIALTANAVAENEKMFLDNGFQAFLSKPINTEKLDAVIRKWIMKDSERPDTIVETKKQEEGITVIIPGVNSVLGLSIYDDDYEMYIDILKSFAEDVPAEIDKLENLSEQSLRGYAIDVHTLKGVTASIGAKELSERAKNLEALAKSGDIEAVRLQHDKFVADMKILTADVAGWLESVDK